MINRQQIFEEAKKHGLIQSGFNMVDKESGIVINSAYMISRVRKLAVNIDIETAFLKFIESEKNKYH